MEQSDSVPSGLHNTQDRPRNAAMSLTRALRSQVAVATNALRWKDVQEFIIVGSN